MPVHINTFGDVRLLVAHFVSDVSIDEFQFAYRKAFRAISGWRDVIKLADLSQLNTCHIQPSVVRDVAERFAYMSGRLGIPSRCLVIAPNDNQYGLASIFRSHIQFSGHAEVYVGRDIDEVVQLSGLRANWITELHRYSAPDASNIAS